MELVTFNPGTSVRSFPRPSRSNPYLYAPRNVRPRTNPPNMYRPGKSYSKTKSSYGRKKPISAGKAVATAKRHNFKVNVERVINRLVEVKKAYGVVQQQGVTSYNQGNLMNVNSMIPYSVVSQGTGQCNRIGNAIRTRKCLFNFTLSPFPYNGALNLSPIPQDVVIMFGVVKNSKAIQPVVTDFQKLFQENNTAIQPSGNLLDCTRMINTDYWTVRKILRYKVGFANYSGTGSQAAPQFYSNNDYKLNVQRSVDLTDICPKLVRFNDTTQQPTNDGLYMWLFAVPADGSTGNQAAPIALNYTLHYHFEDA